MFRKGLIGVVFAVALALSAPAAEVFVRVGPRTILLRGVFRRPAQGLYGLPAIIDGTAVRMSGYPEDGKDRRGRMLAG